MKKNYLDKEFLCEVVAVLEKHHNGLKKLLNLLPKYGLQELYNLCKAGNYKAAREYIEKNY